MRVIASALGAGALLAVAPGIATAAPIDAAPAACTAANLVAAGRPLVTAGAGVTASVTVTTARTASACVLASVTPLLTDVTGQAPATSAIGTSAVTLGPTSAAAVIVAWTGGSCGATVPTSSRVSLRLADGTSLAVPSLSLPKPACGQVVSRPATDAGDVACTDGSCAAPAAVALNLHLVSRPTDGVLALSARRPAHHPVAKPKPTQPGGTLAFTGVDDLAGVVFLGVGLLGVGAVLRSRRYARRIA